MWSVDVEPRDQDDDVLVRRCGRDRLVFVTEDRRQRQDVLIGAAIADSNIGFVEVRFRHAKFETKDIVYRQYLDTLCELVRHPTPFCAVMNNQGFRFVRLDGPLTRRDQFDAGQAASRTE